jgi:hypothetical protein
MLYFQVSGAAVDVGHGSMPLHVASTHEGIQLP